MKKRLLAIAMTLAMTLSLLPVTAGAAGDANVAEVNGTGYPTLQDAFDNARDGDTIKLLANVTLDPLYAVDEEKVEDAPIRNVITVTSDITLDLNSHKISWDSTKISEENAPEIWYTLCFFVVSGADVKITGKGTIDAEAGNNNSYGINITNNGSVTVENGTYTGATTAIQVQEGSLTILDGTFKQAKTIAEQASNYAKYVINCIDANFKNGTARIYVKGGTFCFDPDGKPENSDVTYVPADYVSTKNTGGNTWTVTAKGSIDVDKPTNSEISDGAVDATVGGVGIPTGTEGDVTANDATVTVDATVEAQEGTTVTTANVTVGGDALTAVKNASASLAIKTNVGTLTVSDAALDTIITKATDGSSVADVTLSIKVSESEENSVTYDFTATDARGVEVFGQTASGNATITVTVAAPEGATTGETVYIYYIDGGTRTLEATETVTEDKTVTWDVTHFSSREITKTMDEVTYTNSKGNEVTGTLAEAVENAKENTTITLKRDMDVGTLTPNDAGETVATIPDGKDVILDLAGHTISATLSTDKDTYGKAQVIRNEGTLTIKDSSKNKTGKISASASYGCTATVRNDGTLIIESGEISSAGGNAILNQNGFLAVNGGTLSTTGQFGSFDNGTAAIHNRGDVEINGGVITTEYQAPVWYGAGTDDSTTEIKDGTFNSTHSGVDIQGNSGTVTVTGGKFHVSPIDYVAPGYYVSQSDSFYVVESAGKSVTVYTFDELKSALADTSGTVNITVSGTVTVTEDITVPESACLSIASGGTLAVEDAVLTLDGYLINQGTLDVSGIGSGFISNLIRYIDEGGTITGLPTANDSGVYEIGTAAQLQMMHFVLLYNGDENGIFHGDIALTDDVNLTGYSFLPLGYDYMTAFGGTLDGQGHSITGLTIDLSAGGIGLFSVSDSASFKDLTITDAFLTTQSGVMGTLVGELYGSSNFVNITVSGTYTNAASYYCGGWIGYLGGSEGDAVNFINCTNEMDVTGYYNVGAFWGSSSGSKAYVTMIDCSNSGDVTATGGTIGVIGGFAHNDGTLYNFTNTGTITNRENVVTSPNLFNGGNPTKQVLDNIVAIRYGSDGKAVPYNSLDNALSEDEGGGTVYLMDKTAEITLSTAIPAGVTLVVNDGQTVNVGRTNLTALMGSQGTLQINAGGKLNVAESGDTLTAMIGDKDANLQLTEGSIEFTVDNTDSSNPELNLVLTEDSQATIPTGKRMALVLSSQYPMNFTVESDATLTVDSAGMPEKPGENQEGLCVTKGTLTNNGTITVTGNGAMTVVGENDQTSEYPFTKGEIKGSGKINVSGDLTVNNSIGSNTIVMQPGGEVTSKDNYVTADNITGAEQTEDGKWVYDASSSSSGGSTRYTVTAPADVANGSVKVSPTWASRGQTVTITVTPDEGYELASLAVYDADGDAVSLTDAGNGKYTFTMPRSKVTVEAAFSEIMEEPETLPFADVPTGAYYYDAVAWAVENGVTNGSSATTFSPNMVVTRAQMVTFLWRAYGSPKATGTNPFTDVSESDYYYDAVLWAVANGVTNGTSGTTFSPDMDVTRAQAVTFQWRAAGSPVVSGSSFGDVATDAYYVSAVTWAVANDITNGTGGNNFSPDVVVSRAQAVTFLYREAH